MVPIKAAAVYLLCLWLEPVVSADCAIPLANTHRELAGLKESHAATEQGTAVEGVQSLRGCFLLIHIMLAQAA